MIEGVDAKEEKKITLVIELTEGEQLRVGGDATEHGLIGLGMLEAAKHVLISRYSQPPKEERPAIVRAGVGQIAALKRGAK